MTPPSGTPLPVAIDEHFSMKVGEPVRAHLLYAVYSGDTLLIAEKTILHRKKKNASFSFCTTSCLPS